LKAALHYGVGHVCSEVEGMTFSRELVATITETSFKQCELLATDLELFAKLENHCNLCCLLSILKQYTTQDIQCVYTVLINCQYHIKYIQIPENDNECIINFSFRHTKRTTVSVEDVKLCCRRTPSLLEFISGQADKLKAEKGAGKEGGGATGDSGAAAAGGKKTKGGRKKIAVVLSDD
jgi:hypothetical protein